MMNGHVRRRSAMDAYGEICREAEGKLIRWEECGFMITCLMMGFPLPSVRLRLCCG